MTMNTLGNLCFTQPEWADSRVAMTLSCRDTDRLPKVQGAGEVFQTDGRKFQRMHNGVLIFEGCYYGDWTTQIIKGLGGHHEPQEEVGFYEVLSMLKQSPYAQAPLIVELGAFWAYYSMWFLKEFPEGAAVCLEPDPRYLEVGRRNFALNGLKGDFVWGGIGHGPGTFSFSPESDLFALDAPLGTLDCPQYDLAQLAARAGREVIDVLLCDVQGAETHLLRSSRDFLARGGVRYAVVSTHHKTISGSYTTHQDTVRELRELGARILCEHSVSESFSGDGLVIAAFGSEDPAWDVAISHARAKDTMFGEVEPFAEVERTAVMGQELLLNQVREESAQAVAVTSAKLDEMSKELGKSQVQIESLRVELELTGAMLAASRENVAAALASAASAREEVATANRELDEQRALTAQCARREAQAQTEAQSQISQLQDQLAQILGSKSWKVTKPLRTVLGR